jgi:hypothetical protein
MERPVQLSKEQMSRAQAVWEALATEWEIYEVDRGHPSGLPTVVLRHSPPYYMAAGPDVVVADAIAAHKFDGPHAMEMAKMLKREKIIAEMFKAVLG